MMERESRLPRSSSPRPTIFAALALVLAVAAIGLSGFRYYSSHTERAVTASRAQEAPAPSLPAEPPPVAEAPKAPAPVALPAPPPRPLDAPRPSEQRAAPAPAPEFARVSQPAAEDVKQQSGGSARLVVAVNPRGEIYVDGEYLGTSPPITTFDLEPGMHRVEVRSGSRKPYLTFMMVQAGEVRRIRHDFNAKPIRPPLRASGRAPAG